MDEKEYRPLFCDYSLEGWRACPRTITFEVPVDSPDYERRLALYNEGIKNPGIWTIKDGVVEGRQNPPGSGLGSYLISEAEYGDFELIYEAKPDWPCDTGIYLRASADGRTGYQVLLDHRKSGSIGGFYGNSLGRFHAINWNIDAVYNEEGNAIGLKVENPESAIEPITPDKPALLKYKITGEEFLKIWKWNDWNEFHVICTGVIPSLTTYINGKKIAEIDMDKTNSPKFDREKASKLAKGHIAIEVHDNDQRLGEGRWGKNAACRWRKMRIHEL